MSKNVLSIPDVFKQAVSDWFGKDVQSGYTLSYMWMANELGHFALGFIINFVIAWIYILISGSASITGLIWIASIQAVFWFLKEMGDYIVEFFQAKKQENFPIDRGDIAKDALTAIYFFCCGIAVSFLSFYNLKITLLVYFLSFIPTLLLAYYWIYRKTCFQRVLLPYQYRLSDFQKKFSSDEIINKEICEKIDHFSKDNSDIQVLLIFGEGGSQKSRLAAGIGTEWSFSKGTASFFTFFQFLQGLSYEKQLDKFNGQLYWKWKDAKLLIIDDVNPGIQKLIDSPCIDQPDFLKNCLNDLGNLWDNKSQILSKKSVWIISDTQNQLKWVEVFENYGFEKNRIFSATII